VIAAPHPLKSIAPSRADRCDGKVAGGQRKSGAVTLARIVLPVSSLSAEMPTPTSRPGVPPNARA
jgi:hypothetical protein